MKLIVIAVGQRMPDWVEQGWQEYARRMPQDCAIELREIKAEPDRAFPRQPSAFNRTRVELIGRHHPDRA